MDMFPTPPRPSSAPKKGCAGIDDISLHGAVTGNNNPDDTSLVCLFSTGGSDLLVLPTAINRRVTHRRHLWDARLSVLAAQGDERTEALQDTLRNEGSINKAVAEELDMLLVVS